ncbi:MAG: hypothetical protein ACKVOA_04025 [Methylophilaceae bacterium]
MSKISAMQAEALGLKVVMPVAPAKVATKKPAVKKVVSAKKVVASSQTAKAKPVVAKKAAVKKVAPAKPAIVKSPVAKSKSVLAKKPTTKAKPMDKLKSLKVKMERDSFTMPKDEYAQLALLKARLASLGQPAKKSELLRAGIKLLVTMSDNTLKTTLAKVPVIKTGRPKKK